MAMEGATLNVLLTATDNASPALKGFGSTLADNKMAIRELAMGTMMLGASFMAMGVALKGSNSELGKTVGQTLMMVGSIMTAIGGTVQFISAISKTIHALQVLAASEAVVQALTNPLFLLLGIGAAAGIVAGISAMNKGETKATSNVTINNHIQGSVVTEKQWSDLVRKQIILTQQRNNTSGIK